METLIKEILWKLDASNEEIEFKFFHPDWNGWEILNGTLSFNCFGVATFISEDKTIEFTVDAVLSIEINQKKISVKIDIDSAKEIH